VTDKRIDRETKKLDAKLCDLYDDAFPKASADEEFWKETNDAEDVLVERLKPRPLGVMEIQHACRAYTVAFTAACKAGRQRARKTDAAHGANPG